jgi:xanthine dehydrogenase accessory factor
MIPDALSRRARQLADRGESFVSATVVRAQRPTSVEAGDAALILADGTIEGFVGGACAEHSVRAYALEAIESGEPLLLRILPFGDEEIGPEGREAAKEDGAVTVENPCLSGGALEIFLEPVVPAPRLLVVGDTPIAAALMRLGPELGLDAVAVDGNELEPRPGDLALVVAAHARDELHALRRGLEAELPYVGLVASRKRGDGVLGELRGDGVKPELLARVDVPAGLDIGARTPSEIALSILAEVVAVRRRRPAAARTAVDPICGMTVAAVPGTPSLRHDGELVYFCCEGCKAKFAAGHQHAGAG